MVTRPGRIALYCRARRPLRPATAHGAFRRCCHSIFTSGLLLRCSRYRRISIFSCQRASPATASWPRSTSPHTALSGKNARPWPSSTMLFQAFGHIGFVAGVRWRISSPLATISATMRSRWRRRRRPKRDGLLRAAGQAEGRLAAGGAAGVGAQGFFAQGQHIVARRVEQHGLVRVVVAQQHIAAAAFQRHHRVVHIAGGQPGAEFAAAALDLGQPLGKKVSARLCGTAMFSVSGGADCWPRSRARAWLSWAMISSAWP